MNAQPAIRRRFGIGLVAVLAAVLTSACATGQHAQTADEQPAIDATSGAVGSLQLHNVAIKTPTGPAYQAGDAAELQLIVANTGRDTDTLQSVSTPTSSGFQAFASSADASAELSPSESGSASGSSSAPGSDSTTRGSTSDGSAPTSGSKTSRSASGGSRSSGTTSSRAASRGTASRGSTSSGAASSRAATSGSTSSGSPPAGQVPALDVPAGQALSLGVNGTDHVIVLRLTKTLFPGTALPITFTFAKAGAVTLTVPVQISDQISDSGPPGITIPPLSSGAAG